MQRPPARFGATPVAAPSAGTARRDRPLEQRREADEIEEPGAPAIAGQLAPEFHARVEADAEAPAPVDDAEPARGRGAPEPEQRERIGVAREVAPQHVA